MIDLTGRKVACVYGVMHEDEFGVVFSDRGDQVVVLLDREEDVHLKYIAKYRLLCNEYPEYDLPPTVGVYLINEEA